MSRVKSRQIPRRVEHDLDLIFIYIVPPLIRYVTASYVTFYHETNVERILLSCSGGKQPSLSEIRSRRLEGDLKNEG